MSEQFEIIRSAPVGDTPVLQLRGRLDAAAAQQLRGACQDLRAEDHLRVVIGLTDVTFVASSGLGMFLLLTEEFGDAGGKVIFAAPSNTVKRVIALLNLGQFLELAESVEDALSAVVA